METILIIDDNEDTRTLLSGMLEGEGYKTIAVGDGKGALKEVKERSPNLALLDIRLPGMDGMKVLEEMRRMDNDMAVIMLTAFGDVKGAVKAMRLGAFDYIQKPFDNEELLLIIQKALETQSLSREVKVLRKRLAENISVEEIMRVRSPQIRRVLKQVKIVTPTNITVIIQGESGTGKEIIANMIYQDSPRKDKPFIAIDCGAIPETLFESELFGYEKGAFSGAVERKEGRFEQANGGTLFLDEINNLPLPLQMKLLRVIETGRLQHLGGKRDIKVDVRIIVATNIHLDEMVRQGRFREDLFHRLNEFRIDLPPLRERRDDIPILARDFLDGANQELNKGIKGFSTEAMELLLNYHWPGNVRELKNVIKRAVLLAEADYILPSYLSLEDIHPSREIEPAEYLDRGASLHELTEKAIKEMEQEVIKKVLAHVGGNKARAARLLRIDRSTLYSKIREYQPG